MRTMCGVQLNDKSPSDVLMLMLGLNEAIDHLLWQPVFIGIVMC